MAYPRVGLNVICLIRSGNTSYWHNMALEKVSPRPKPDKECSVRDELSTPSLGFLSNYFLPFFSLRFITSKGSPKGQSFRV